MTAPLAYRAVPQVTRERFISAMQAHQDADRIMQGRYWSRGRGCSVGCGVQSVMALTGRTINHAAASDAASAASAYAYAAARQAAFIFMGDKLCELPASAPIGEAA